jgi:glucosamine 6-phosphate synthetase-like amidotransferase/phosphosugar isomerase protein
VYGISLQQISYYETLIAGAEVDKSRDLAISETVERAENQESPV